MEQPTIAEKIRFWEEQQKINTLLVPRVVELSSTSEKISELLDGLRKSVGVSESKLQSRIKSVEAEVRSLSRQIDSIAQDTKRAQQQASEVGSRLEESLADLREKLGILASESGRQNGATAALDLVEDGNVAVQQNPGAVLPLFAISISVLAAILAVFGLVS